MNTSMPRASASSARMAAPAAISPRAGAPGWRRRGADISTWSWSGCRTRTSRSRRVTPTCSLPCSTTSLTAAPLSAHVLLGQDNLKLVSDDENQIDSAGDGSAAHGWLSLNQNFARLQSSTVLATSTVRQNRDAQGADEQRTGDVHADFAFRFLDLRSDWSWTLSDSQVLRFGANLGSAQAEYDYTLIATLRQSRGARWSGRHLPCAWPRCADFKVWRAWRLARPHRRTHRRGGRALGSVSISRGTELQRHESAPERRVRHR